MYDRLNSFGGLSDLAMPVMVLGCLSISTYKVPGTK